MKAFKDEVNHDRKRKNKQWGELANKQGTIDEDIIAPATALVIRKYWNCDVDDLSVRRKVRRNGLRYAMAYREWDYMDILNMGRF